MNMQKIVDRASNLSKQELQDLILKCDKDIKLKEEKMTNMSVGEKLVAMNRLDEMKRMRTRFVYLFNQKRA